MCLSTGCMQQHMINRQIHFSKRVTVCVRACARVCMDAGPNVSETCCATVEEGHEIGAG